MKKSLSKGDFNRATIALATLCGLLTMVGFLPASCQGQDADGVQRLMLRIQQMDAEHNPSPCMTASGVRSQSLAPASSGIVLAPRSVKTDDAPPTGVRRNTADGSPQIVGALTPVIAPEVFDPEPNVQTQFDGRQTGSQDPGGYSSSVPASLAASSTSTRPLTTAQASKLWKRYCTKDDSLSPTTCGVVQDCSCRN